MTHIFFYFQPMAIQKLSQNNAPNCMSLKMLIVPSSFKYKARQIPKL